MKEILHDWDEQRMSTERRTQVSDVRTLRALANPVRYRVLGHLMSAGSQTATQCAAAVGASASNCSYHLRELARYGLVERAPATESDADGRDRPWRPTATGLRYGPRDDDNKGDSLLSSDPVAHIANRRLIHLGIDDNAALAHSAADAHDDLPADWRRAEFRSTFGLLVTADELAILTTAVDAILRPYIGLTRDDPPPDARRVHVIFDAFRRRSAAATASGSALDAGTHPDTRKPTR